MRTDHEGCPLRKNVQLVWPIIRKDNTTSTCFSLCTGTYHYPTVGLKRLYIFLSTSLLSYIPLTDSSWSNNHLWNTDVWCNHNICRFSHFFFCTFISFNACTTMDPMHFKIYTSFKIFMENPFDLLNTGNLFYINFSVLLRHF